MNEERIEKLIKFKLDAIDKLLEKMPQNISSDVKNIEKVIAKTISENISQSDEKEKNTPHNSGKLNKVQID